MAVITRRQFLELSRNAAAALGVSAFVLSSWESAFASPTAPSVIWLEAAACSGCSVSLLNRISTSSPTSVGDLLVNTINLQFHETLMSASGDAAVSVIQAAQNSGNYILVVEGGIPTAFNGGTGLAWSQNGSPVTMQTAVQNLVAKTKTINAIGTCASFGGMAAAGPNPAGIRSVSAATGKKTLNIAGCPAHPDWTVWAISQLISGASIAVDSNGRPKALYGSSVHSQCPRRGTSLATAYGQDNHCMKGLGCQGPQAAAQCPSIGWNNGQNFCTNSNSQCIACTSPTFPASQLR